MHDARRRRRRLSWSADRGGSAYGTVGVLAVEVASRESSRREGREEKERRRDGKKERERDRHEASVEEALYTGWILVRPSVSCPNLRHRHREHRKHTRSCHRDRDHLSRGRSLLLLTGHAPHSRFRPHPGRKGIIPNREGFTALGLAQRHLLRGTVLGRVRSWGIAMATYAAYRHVELDNVGYGKKRYDNMCETEREREREKGRAGAYRTADFQWTTFPVELRV